MQFKTIVPDKGASATLVWQGNGQDKRWASFPHRQDHTPALFGDRLSRPFDRVEAFGTPGVLHLHLWVSLAQFSGRLDRGEEGTYYHLNRLAMQCKLPPFGGFLQLVSSGPRGMVET